MNFLLPSNLKIPIHLIQTIEEGKLFINYIIKQYIFFSSRIKSPISIKFVVEPNYSIGNYEKVSYFSLASL